MPKRSWITGENEFWSSAAMNNRTYTQFLDRLIDIAISSIEWEGLPEGIDQRFLELTLLRQGRVALFKDDVTDEFIVLPFSNDGLLDIYNNPISYRAYANNGYQRELTNKDSVICWNNQLRKSSIMELENYAYRLYQVQRAIDINTNAQKTPILIRCSENQRLVLKNLYMKYDGNQPFIFGDKDLDRSSMEVLTTGAPYLVDKLQTQKDNIWNDAMTYLGISNVSVEKRERLISDEVKHGMGGVLASRYSRMDARNEFAKLANNMFGLNMRPKFKNADMDITEPSEGISESEVDGNE